MKFYNGFGITPTKNFTAAGWDFYVPNIDELPEEKINKFLSEDGIQKSYNISKEQIDNLLLEIDNYKNKEDSEISKLINNNKYNILQCNALLEVFLLYQILLLYLCFPHGPVSAFRETKTHFLHQSQYSVLYSHILSRYSTPLYMDPIIYGGKIHTI